MKYEKQYNAILALVTEGMDEKARLEFEAFLRAQGFPQQCEKDIETGVANGHSPDEQVTLTANVMKAVLRG
jgi:hypothetical protein